MDILRRWRIPFCPDCGDCGTHAATCSMFPSHPVEHGNFEWVGIVGPTDHPRGAVTDISERKAKVIYAAERWAEAYNRPFSERVAARGAFVAALDEMDAADHLRGAV